MPDPNAQLSDASIEVVDIRRLVDKAGGSLFSASMLIDAGDHQHRSDGLIVRVGPRGERAVWAQTYNPDAMTRVPPNMELNTLRGVLARAERAIVAAPILEG